MKIEHYLSHTDYLIWQVIHNGNGLVFVTTDINGTTTSPSSNTQNVALVSANNTSSTNDVSTAYSVSSPSVLKSQKKGSSSYTNEVIHSFLANQSSAPQLDYDDLKQINDDDIEDILLETTELKRIKTAEEDMLDTMETKLETMSRHVEEDAQNYAMMAYSSSNSGSDKEVKFCSKTCEESYAKLKKFYDERRYKLGDANVEITAYTLALRKKLLAESFKEKEELKTKFENWRNSSKNIIILLNTQMGANDKFRLGYGDYRYGTILSYKNEVLQSVFMNKKSNLEDTPVNDRYAKGMHVVPSPMTVNYMPSRPDVEIDYSKFTYGPKQTSVDELEAKSNEYTSCESNSSVETTTSMPAPVENALKVICEPKVWTDVPIIEEYESDGDNDSVSNVQQDKEKLSFAFTNSSKHVKPSRENVKETSTPNQCPKLEKQGRNGLTKKGLGYAFTRKACFVCGSLTYLIRDCDFQEKRIAKQATLTKSKHKVVIGETQEILRTKSSNSGSMFRKSVKDPLGRLKQMTWNKAHLGDYQEFKGGSVAFGSRNGRITSKGKIKARSFNLNNIDPSVDLACLFAKASIDECNKWHRRLGHVNFKNIKKLVKGNLVRGLPSKIFENDHTCVACQKGKQHKASWIKREYSNARTPQQNRVAERKNMTLIKAARTMLADLFLPTTFWAEAVNIACYVLNRFDGKSDLGFLVGYSLNSKGFRVYNLETKRVEENLHVNFLEKKPNGAGKGHAWMFDLDYLTNSMNYEPVLLENQANKSTGPKEANNSAGIQANDDQGANSEEMINMMNILYCLYGLLTQLLSRAQEIRFKRPLITRHVRSQLVKLNKSFRKSLISLKDRKIYQMDMKSAFLYGTIDEELCVTQPPRFIDPKFLNKVYKVVKALYGLHQAPRACVKTASTPIETQKPLVKDEEAADVNVKLYRFQVTPKTSHVQAVKRIFRKSTTRATLVKERLPEVTTVKHSKELASLKQTALVLIEAQQHISNESSLLGVNTPRCDEDSIKLKELMVLCSKLSNRVFTLEQSKTAQDLVIKKLQKKVKRIERKIKARTPGMTLFKIGNFRRKSLDKENVSKQETCLKTRPKFEESNFDNIDDMADEDND
uniref:Uncharacterized protein n=1 Tax=Tanacetum cinerariifolium TaxID=118510 RepID=A0A6L2J395_TANCI|nr:hypothetical protein [Tanacetum cinerariifolium]